MGQQQLLLVILVTVIVGIATVVAINTFGSASVSANRDAVLTDISAIAAASQSFYTKPAMMGGGSNSFNGIDFKKFAFTGKQPTGTGGELISVNENGTYIIAAPASPFTSYVLTAVPASCPGYIGKPEVVTSTTTTAPTAGATIANCVFTVTVRANSMEVTARPTL